MDWKAWHDKYDDPASDFSKRLATVRDRIRDALDQRRPPGRCARSACARARAGT